MKKIYLIVALSISSVTLLAQVTGGLKGGVNLSSQKWEIKVLGESITEKFDGVGFHFGGYITYALNDNISLQPELLYNGLQFQLEFDTESEDVSLNYLSLPVMFGYAFDDNKFILQAGPQIGFLLSTDPKEYKDEDFYNELDFSFAFGATANFGKFNVSARYGIGIANVASEQYNDLLEATLEDLLGYPVDTTTTFKNNNLQFSVGYRLFGE